MPKITFLPIEKTCEGEEGESILDIAINHDIPLQHACGGFCACTTCHVIVREGAENLSDIAEDERERLENTDAVTPESRLGCQARLMGNVTVQIVNLEE